MPDATLVLSRGRCPASALEACHLEGMKSEEIRATSLETLRQMVGVGLGVSLFPRLAAAPENPHGPVALRSLAAPGASRTIGLAWRRRSAAARTMAKLAETLAHRLPEGVAAART